MITPMQHMQRHFTQGTYDRFYAIFRRAYRLGGYDLIERIYDSVMRGDVYYPQGKRRIRAAYLTFLCR